MFGLLVLVGCFLKKASKPDNLNMKYNPAVNYMDFEKKASGRMVMSNIEPASLARAQ